MVDDDGCPGSNCGRPGTVDPLTATATFTTSGTPILAEHYLDVKVI